MKTIIQNVSKRTVPIDTIAQIKTEYASRELARRHYAEYLAYAHGLSWKKTRMSTFLANQVQEFIEAETGHAYDILVVNCPPQHGKSMTITESLPSWYLGKYPRNHVIIASYDSDFAERFCKKNKEKIRNVGGRLFGIEIGAIDRAAEFELAPRLSRRTSPGDCDCGRATSTVSDAKRRIVPGDCDCGRATSTVSDGDSSRSHLLGDRLSTVPTDTLTGSDDTASDQYAETRNVTNRTVPVDTIRAGGRLIARGIMSGITGNPANLVIIDDPVKNQLEADSPTYRQRLWCEWQASIKSRLSAGAKVIIIMTPWREDVFDMEVIRTEAHVRHLKLPVEAQENDALGRRPGEPLCPELGKDERWLAEFRESYINDPLGGQRAWAAMYLCSPRVEDGNLIKREWWRYYRVRNAERVPRKNDSVDRNAESVSNRTVPVDTPADTGNTESVSNRTVPVDTTEEPAEYGTEIISVDAAFKDAETNDFVSVQVWGKRGNDYFLRYCMNRHLNFPDTVEAIRTVAKLYPKARMILIEEAANGAAIIQTLQRELFILPVTPKGGKVARVNAVSAAIESGHVFVPYPYQEVPYQETPNLKMPDQKVPDQKNIRCHEKGDASVSVQNNSAGCLWVNDFIDQWTAFPNAKHDDMVDAGSQALSRLFESSGEVYRAGAYDNSAIDLEAMYDPYR